MAALTELSLFTGAGGGVLASALLGHRVVCYVERDPYCVRVLKQRIADGLIDDAPIWDDVRTFDGRPWVGLVDVVSAGFPCQPFSLAGEQRADGDERNGWPDTVRIIREVRPRLALLENVPGLLTGAHGYFGTVVGDLAESGYDAVWDCLPASALGAPHRRDRLWIVAADAANREGVDLRREGRNPGGERQRRSRHARPSGVAHADPLRRTRRSRLFGQGGRGQPADGGWWSAEPGMGRVAHGVADWVDRLTALGNGQVPIVAATAYRLLAGE